MSEPQGCLRALTGLAALGGSIWAAWDYGPQAGGLLAQRFPVLATDTAFEMAAGYGGVFIGALAAAGLTERLGLYLTSADFRRGLPRALKGWLAYAPIRAALGGPVAWAAWQGMQAHGGFEEQTVTVVALVAGLTAFQLSKPVARFVMRGIARATRGMRRRRTLKRFGEGGSAQWGGLLDNYDCRFTPGAVFMGWN